MIACRTPKIRRARTHESGQEELRRLSSGVHKIAKDQANRCRGTAEAE
jgi:hypothetical protein